MTTTTNLADFGNRELKEAEDLLKARREQGFPPDFEDIGVTIMFNTHSGAVFFTNDEYQVCMLNGNGELRSWYVMPYDGYEGFIEDLAADWDHIHDEDKPYLEDIISDYYPEIEY